MIGPVFSVLGCRQFTILLTRQITSAATPLRGCFRAGRAREQLLQSVFSNGRECITKPNGLGNAWE